MNDCQEAPVYSQESPIDSCEALSEDAVLVTHLNYGQRNPVGFCRPAFLVVAALNLASAAASVALWWRTRSSYAQEYLVVRPRAQGGV